jgi:replication initiation protein RepC
MHAHTAPPTGRRKITPPQLRAEAAGAVPLPPTSPGRALAAFKRAAVALGVPRRVVDLVDCLMSYSPAQDWEGGPGLGPIVWPSDAELEDRLCVGPSQRKVIVRAALDAGFMRLRRSPTGKRWGHRDKGGRQGHILDAYGFDLAPLAERTAEFGSLAAEWETRRDEGRRLRREITSSRNHVLSLVDLATAQDLDGAGWSAAAVQADALWRERGNQRDPLPLVPIAARLRALSIHVQEQVAAALAAVEAVKNGPVGPEYRPHLTTTNQLSIAAANTSSADEAGPSRPMADREASSDDLPSPQIVQQQGRVGPTRASEVQPSALQGFVVTPGFILAVAPAFRDWTSSARAGWDELDRAAAHVRSALGISPHAWGQARILLGQEEAVTMLATICARHADGKVRSPGGLLRRMVELHQQGMLRLDRTLFGLVEKLGSNGRGGPAVKPSTHNQVP